MPGDRFTFAVGVGREDEAVGAFDRFRDLGNVLGALRLDLPFHGEVILGINRAILRRQVAHMPEGSEDVISAPEIFIDGLRLRRRFDDDDFHDVRLARRA